MIFSSIQSFNLGVAFSPEVDRIKLKNANAEVERDQIKLQQSNSKYFPKSRTETINLS